MITSLTDVERLQKNFKEFYYRSSNKIVISTNKCCVISYFRGSDPPFLYDLTTKRAVTLRKQTTRDLEVFLTCN